MTDQPRAHGKIIYINENGGWGFINSFDLKFERIFFHFSGLDQKTLRFPELKKGMEVEFTPVKFEGGNWRAIKIIVKRDD